jgi:predicted porin
MAASADATIYGAIHTSVQFNDVEANNTTIQDNITVEANDGALGIKGSEDLGNGLKAVYKIETNFDTESGGTTFTTDEVWVGLSSGWGTAAIGRDDHPYKNAINATGYNPFGDKILDMDANSQNIGGVGFRQATADNAIAYISPNFSGFSFTGAIVAPEGNGADDPLNDGLNDSFDAYSLGANFKAGGLKLGVGYEDIDVRDGEDDVSAWFVGGSYTFGAFMVGAAYEQQEDATANALGTSYAVGDVDTLGISATFTFGNNVIGANYVMEEQDDVEATFGGGGDIDIDSWGVDFTHNLSNRTAVYAAYAQAEHDGDGVDGNDADDDRFALGVIHSF